VCDERGHGIDKAVTIAEQEKLANPRFACDELFTRVTLLGGPKKLSDMSQQDRINACFQHTCLRCHNGHRATNSSLRARFDAEKTNAAAISRLFKETKEKGLIKLADETSPKSGYVPYYWS
ncbi:MAG: transcriptional regulator, partial [Rhodomicrobium sp.]